ncbi:hypothetical protein NNJEOMEG_01838 [Fundidesulfovibrio magnetotacticus]|uniref:Uncharacterized protein n=2 Tax=Fundidesulfovibrio magnetotacticus TaxID=2730080 RepID=A0A6V8LSR7_9BACT|nr:hypothetical protein NNJEOMEG_01838 [Fundidesulfovibrio magnetotacticus]
MCGTLYDHHAPPSLEYFLSKPQETVEVLKWKIPQVRDDKEILIVSRVLWDIHKSGGVNVSCDKELLDSWHAVLVRMRSSWLADKSWSCYQATLAAPGPPCGQ